MKRARRKEKGRRISLTTTTRRDTLITLLAGDIPRLVEKRGCGKAERETLFLVKAKKESYPLRVR